MRSKAHFPAEANGWTRAGDTRVFGRDTVFDYMDGAGELYLAYDFQRVHVQDYVRDGGPRIVAEAYEMASGQDACGVFSNDPEGEDVGVGQGNAYAMGLLCMWKGAWFFRILAESATPEAKAAVVAIARALAEPIADGPKPQFLGRLPSSHLEAASVRYFHTHVTLNSLYYLADENILGLSPRTEAALATYRPSGGKLVLLLVRHPSARDAQSAYREFSRVYLKDKPPPDGPRRIETIEGGQQVGVLIKDTFLALVFEATSRGACQRLLDAVAKHL